jgi:hypothetical protein
MVGSVPHGHLGLDPAKELVEVDTKVLQEHGQGRQRRHGMATFDRAHERAAERRAHRRLAEARCQPATAEFQSDRGGEARSA